MHLSPEKEAYFPNLRREDYRVTSKADWRYNCVAYAADNKDAPWWPMAEPTEGVFWPERVAREESLSSFVAAFGTLGYVLDANSDLEFGIEKVAIYVDADGVPTHAAKQLPSGGWTSKLGDWEDIEHNSLRSLEGVVGAAPGYGKVSCILQRTSRGPD